MPHSASISKHDFEQYLSKRQSFEHVSCHQVFIEEPEFLVILIWVGHDDFAVYGGYIANREEVADAVMFRATELLDCSMVDPILYQCKARVLWPEGEVWFIWDPDKFLYVIGKP